MRYVSVFSSPFVGVFKPLACSVLPSVTCTALVIRLYQQTLYLLNRIHRVDRLSVERIEDAMSAVAVLVHAKIFVHANVPVIST